MTEASQKIAHNERYKRAKEKTYSSIVSSIKAIYQNNITNEEANSAARNLISLCRLMMEYQEAKRRSKENNNK